MTTEAKPRRLSQSKLIFLGLALGVVAGVLINRLGPADAARIAGYIKPFSLLFLRLIKMVIAPLLFATLVVGIAGAGQAKAVGRIGVRAIVYFEVVTTIALLIGLVVVNMAQPGVGVALPAEGATTLAAPQTWDQILL